MKFLTGRFIVALVTFVAGVTAASLGVHHPARHSTTSASPVARPQTRDRSEEILRVLMPNGVWGAPRRLGRFDRSEEIRALRGAQVDAKDWRALTIAALLAALGHDYEANRGRLLDALGRCSDRPHAEAAWCKDFIAEHLMELCRRGDTSLFQPIFDVSDKADGAYAQSLGAFYSDMLWEKPEQFIKALESRPRKERHEFCYRAGVGDGGGMNEGRLRDVMESLKRLSARHDNSLAPVARTCMSGVEAGHKLFTEDNES
jgi:hypothetical protein